MMPAFYLNFGLRKIEVAARECGFSGANWKQDLLADLLHDGRLCVEKAHDLRDPSKRVWYCVGKRASLACVPDAEARDALFCIGLVPGPQAGGPGGRPKGRQFHVPGPWGVHTFGRRQPPPITIEEHLLKCGEFNEEVPVAPSPKKRRAALVATPSASTATTLTTSFAALIAPSGIAGDKTARTATMPTSGQTMASEPTATASSTHGPMTAPAGTQPALLFETIDSQFRALAAPPEQTDSQPNEPEKQEISHQFDTNASVPSAATSTTSPPPPVTPVFWEAAEPQLFQGHGAWDALAVATITRAEPALDGILQAPDPSDARRQRIAALEAEIARLRADLAAVPDDTRIIEGDEQRRRISDLGARVGPKPPPEVCVRGPAALEALLAAFVDESAHNLPRWALGFDVEDDADRLSALGDPAKQARLLAALDWVRQRFAGAPPDRLRAVPSPDETGQVQDMLELAWSTEETLSAAIGTLPAPCLPLLRAIPTGNLQHAVNSLSRWVAALSPAAFEDLVSTVSADPGERFRMLDPSSLNTLAPEDSDFLREMGSFELARRFIERVQRPNMTASVTASVARGRDSTGRILDFAHVLTDDRAKIVAASIVVPPPERGFVLLGFPVRITADAQVARDLTVTVTSPALAAVSRDAVLPEGVRIQSVPGTSSNVNTKFELNWQLLGDEARWRQIEAGRYSREEILPFPITLGEAAKLRERKTPRLSLVFTIADVTTTLQWESFLKQMPELAARTGVGDASASDLVRGRPLGAQVQYEKLEGVVAEGRHSFMVVAPRRFGKTTLYHHLGVHALGAGHEVVQISLERDLSPELAVQKLWEGLRRNLEERFNASPALGEALPKTVMDDGAWTAVRRFVREKTDRSLVVLIDEAQALVPRNGGQRWGNQFKNFIERRLFEPSEKMALVQFGLFGTVDLSVRIGQNCRDFLLMHGTEQYAFDEASLARFLRTVGQGAILSSKAARLELASWTSNLRTLNSVFDRVRAHVIQHQQAFILDVDVRASIGEILSSDSHLAEEIWTYARAELSHRDEWEPVDSFPLAVAWARPELANMPQPQRLEDCVRWLSQELMASGASGSVPTERVEASLRDLKTRGVLRDDGEFYRPLLRELLKRRPHVLRQDRDSQMALLRLAVDDVEWPDQAEPRDEGGEAKIFIQTRGDRTLAYRACKLDNDDNRRRFARTCAAIRTLRDRRTKMPGDDHLPRVMEAGFRRDNASEGIIVYEWVEGETFEKLWSKLPVQGRAHVVRQVAMAVSALHARDVIHCDIAPRNIIVSGRLDATLIDFGLARRADQATHTRLAQDHFKAPEQCDEPPSVDKASDIYALAILLRGPEPNADMKPAELRDLVEKMRSHRADERPTIVEVVKRLDETVDFEPLLHQHKTAVEDVVNDAPEWLWEELLQASGQATLVHGDYLPWDLQRAMEVSFLLNNLFVKIVSERRGAAASKLATCGGADELSLASVRSKIRNSGETSLREWEQPDVKAVGLMRIALSHPRDRATRVNDAMRELRSREQTFEADIRVAVNKVAGMLDGLAEVSNSRVITKFVSFFTREK